MSLPAQVIWRHTLGDPKEKDALIYEEKDELYSIGARRSRSRQYIFLVAASSRRPSVSRAGFGSSECVVR